MWVNSGSWTRTSDTRIMIPMLYQLSYAAKKELVLAKIAGGGLEPPTFGL